jgi:nitronate monooxygenase
VLAAGGIADGRGLAAVLALGCDGAVLGTRLWASKEAVGSDVLKAALVTASGDDVMRTQVFDALANAVSPTPWPAPFDSVGALRNETTARWHHHQAELEATIADGGAESSVVQDFRESSKAADVTKATVLAGEGVGLVASIDGVEEIVRLVEAEAVAAIQAMSGTLVVDEVAVARL